MTGLSRMHPVKGTFGQAVPSPMSRSIVAKASPSKQGCPPGPSQVQHSRAFLTGQHQRAPPDDLEEGGFGWQEAAEQRPVPKPFRGNAVQWLLAKVDKRLAEVEGRPLGKGPAKAWVDASQSPAGLQAGKMLGATFRLSGMLAGAALQGAVPIGKWAAKQGLGISWALLRGSSNQKRKR